MVLELSLATWLVTTLTSVFVTATGFIIRDFIEDYKRSQEETRRRIDISNRAVPSNFKPIHVPSESIIPNDKVVTQMIATLNMKIGGLFVIAAPMGSGKTSYLAEALSIFQKQYNRPVYYFNGLTEDCLEALGIPRGRFISEYIDLESVIVIDQVDKDIDVLPENLKELLTKIATESRNTKKFHAVILVSNPKLFGSIMRLNGGEKIFPAIDYADFKWDKTMMTKLAKSLLPNLDDNDIDNFVAVFESSKTPGLLFSYANRVKNCSSFGLNNRRKLSSKVSALLTARANVWSEFEDLQIQVFEEEISIPD